MRYILLILLWLPLGTFAQHGVKFLENTTWENVVALAKQQNKMIFVDCYASWCVPCKVVDQAVFQTEVAGNYFNQNFINYKVQMDTAKTDGSEKIKHYPDARKLKALAEVVNYPTYAFFSPDGEILHRFVGGTHDPMGFIAMAAAAMEPERQFYTLKRLLDSINDPDRDLLKRAAIAYQRNADYKNGFDEKSRTLASEYLRKSNPTELLTKENIEFMLRYTSSIAHSGFTFFLNHAEEIDTIAGKGASFGLIERCIFRSVIDSAMQGDDVPRWHDMEIILTNLYPQYAKVLFGKAKIQYYSKKQDWATYIQVVNQLTKATNTGDMEKNLSNYAFEVYLHTTEKSYLREALRWSEFSLQKNTITEQSLIIHAGILYALGSQKETISSLQKAEAMASDSQTKAFIVDALKKVRSNLPLLDKN